MKPKVLLIGIGFIGNNVARKLKALGYEVELYDIVFGHDMLNVRMLEAAIKRNDYVIQMAAIADLNVFEAQPLKGMQINIWGTVLVANYCTKHKKRLYYISTCCVYGNTIDLPSSEIARPIPSEIYAEAKLAGEHIIKAYSKSYDLDYVILRIATTYGPEMRDSLAPAVFLGKILSGEPVTVHGNGNQTRTLTYIEDEADGIVAAITHPDVKNQIINISAEEELSVLDWIRIIGEVVGQTPKIEYVKDRKGQTYREAIDASKAYRLLGWKARHSFRSGIEKTYEWMKQIWDGKW
jgi:nucleoside-diphosphate-sugar epimerase